MNIAALIRKSPTKSEDEDKAIKKHIDLIKIYCKNNYKNYDINWYIDICSGDDELGRIELHKFFNKINEYTYAICFDVDRFSRSWLGLKWFEEYFRDSNCKLIFLDGTKLYDENGNVDPESYLFFHMKCGIAAYELFKIRQRTAIGRNRILSNPELRAKKYKGRRKGAKDKKKRKLRKDKK
jgi:hypothetical protein